MDMYVAWLEVLRGCMGERPLIFGIRSDDPEREMFQNSITFFPRIHEALPLYICCCVS